MGLDIMHYKATLKKPDKELTIDDYEIIEDSRSFNVPFDHFSKYIQPILVTEIVRILKVTYNMKKLRETAERHMDEEWIYCENDEQLKRYLSHYETTVDMNVIKREEYKNWDDTLHIYYTEEQWRQGFYIQQVGYQRKGINVLFWETFCKGPVTNFARQQDFELALSCVIPDVDDNGVEYRQKEFKENFVDKFEDGTSFMAVSI